MRVLIVEDNVLLAERLCDDLQQHLFNVEVAYTGARAREILRDNMIDLVLLDLDLPDVDGMDLLVVMNKKNVPVIIVSGKTEVLERIKGLNLGAIDYVTKPYDLMELVARMNRVLRIARGGSSVLIYADIEFDQALKLVKRAGKKIKLNRKEMEILYVLILHAEEVVKRDVIFEAVWNTSDPFDFRSNTFEVTMSSLRRKLCEFGGSNLIKNINSVGYILAKKDLC